MCDLLSSINTNEHQQELLVTCICSSCLVITASSDSKPPSTSVGDEWISELLDRSPKSAMLP